MSKVKTTRKSIVNAYCNIISVGYCGMQNLLHYEEPLAYTSGTYGWNCDLYYINDCDMAITTGYRGMVSKLDYDYKKLDELEKMAEKIIYNNDIKYEDAKTQVHSMLVKFLEDVRKENNR